MKIIIAIIALVVFSPTFIFLGVIIYENNKLRIEIEKEEEWHQ